MHKALSVTLEDISECLKRLDDARYKRKALHRSADASLVFV